MSRNFNTVGGGANTNVNGLEFERTTSLRQALTNSGRYEVDGNALIDKETGLPVGHFYEKHSLYNKLLAGRGIDHKSILSKMLLPDEALLVGSTLYIIEKKYQAGAGSVDEKLQTCHFKLRQYAKLMAPLGFKVKYYYVLSDWFYTNRASYKDVLEYITDVGCKYYFGEIPFADLGLAAPVAPTN